MKVLLIDQIAKVNYKYTFPLANGLVKHGVEVCLVIDQKEEMENCKCERIKLFNTDEKSIGKLKKLINYILSYSTICKILKEEKYDVIHTEWYTFSPVDYYFLNRIKKRYNVKYVATVHDILPFNEKKYDMFFHRKLYGLADSIILQAPINVERFAKLFPQHKHKTHMIPHGHMLDYVEVTDKEDSRKMLNLPEDKKIVLFFGQIKKVKGVDVLLKAAVKLHKKYPQLYFVVAGSVWKSDFTECQEIIERENMEEYLKADIRYIPDEEVKYYYSACDICALPYTDVYQSGVIQLAYGYRKPVVSTTLDAFTQFVKEGVTGFLAEPGDADSFASAIERALTNVNQLDKIGTDGYEVVKTELNWDNLAHRILEECYKS